MKKIIKFLAFLFMTVFLNTAFGATGEIETGTGETSSGSIDTTDLNSAQEEESENSIELNSDQDKTIKELNYEVKRLNKEKVTNNIKASRLKANINIDTFFRSNLNKEEIRDLKKLLYIYNEHRDSLDKKLEEESEKLKETEQIKKGLMDNKREIYKKLIPYIKKENFGEYLEFIKNDVVILRENSDIKDDSIKKNIILEEKLDNIKEKIIEHKEKLSKKLKEVISIKINQKIDEFKNSERFQLLEEKQKEDMIKTLIFKVDEKIEKQKNIQDKTTLLIKKIEIYIILKEKLESLLLE